MKFLLVALVLFLAVGFVVSPAAMACDPNDGDCGGDSGGDDNGGSSGGDGGDCGNGGCPTDGSSGH